MFLRTKAQTLRLLLSLIGFAVSACREELPISVADRKGMIHVTGGVFRMGTDQGFAYEGPIHEVELSPYWLDEHEVTVAEFARFVAATGWVTDAERLGWSGVFDFTVGEWRRVDGVNWRTPRDPAIDASPDEPVTQVSFADASRYAAWCGKRLPTEAEYEFASRASRDGALYAWGDELVPSGRHLANLWQGTFPDRDLGLDGFVGVAPVKSFPANAWGFFDLVGNVWEWCADAYEPAYYVSSPRRDPRGPAPTGERSIRGGSFLCSENFCRGYRLAARNHTPDDSGLDHLGFRCAADDEPRR